MSWVLSVDYVRGPEPEPILTLQKNFNFVATKRFLDKIQGFDKLFYKLFSISQTMQANLFEHVKFARMSSFRIEKIKPVAA